MSIVMSNYLTVEQVANGLKVMPKDILQWIAEGKLKAIKKEEAYAVSVDEYQRYGKSFPTELREKLGQYFWQAQLKIAPDIEKEVADRFRANISVVLKRDKTPIEVMEAIHRKYEPQVDIFNDKRGSVAAFILYSRIVSLLHSIVLLLESGVPSESFILFRPLWEAILLSEYFELSEVFHENQKQIRHWFAKDETPQPREVRYYLSQKTGLPIDILKQLNHGYSMPIHHAYSAIMQSYRGMSMTGFLGDFSQRQGFDYHRSRTMRDVVQLVTAFESLLMSSIQIFIFCFSNFLTEEESESLRSEMSFYSQEPSDRLKIIISDKD